MWGLKFGKQFKIFSGEYMQFFSLLKYMAQKYHSKFISVVVNSDRGL